MTRTIESYPLKLPQRELLSQQLDYLKELALQAGQQLLERLWSEEWLKTLGKSPKKAYKVIGEGQVQITHQDQPVYLPSRIRRCIAERVGRILRSQVKRYNCYSDVLRIVQTTGVEGRLDRLVKTVALTLIGFEGKYYRRALIRQILRTLRRYYYKLGLDLGLLQQIPYTKMFRPVIRSFTLPYSPDDGQAIRYDWHNNVIAVQLKLPRTSHPLGRSDWQWLSFSLVIPSKIYRRVQSPTKVLHSPTLRYITLKGGLVLPFLEFGWTIKRKKEKEKEREKEEEKKEEGKSSLYSKRVMATDLGVINLATSVICEAGSQISPPLFWSPDKRLLHKIEQLYLHIGRLQRKLALYPGQWLGQGRRRQECARLHRKLNRYRRIILHLVSNHLLKTALSWQCQTIVLEDLRNYEPPRNKGGLSRKLSNWLRGSLYELLVYKASRFGLKVKRVPARWTSSYCPRCGIKGQKIVDPSGRVFTNVGRFFSCPSCHYTADRDYIASVNIYRLFQEQQSHHFRLDFARPVSYMGTGIPRDRPRGELLKSS